MELQIDKRLTPAAQEEGWLLVELAFSLRHFRRKTLTYQRQTSNHRQTAEHFVAQLASFLVDKAAQNGPFLPCN